MLVDDYVAQLSDPLVRSHAEPQEQALIVQLLCAVCPAPCTLCCFCVCALPVSARIGCQHQHLYANSTSKRWLVP